VSEARLRNKLVVSECSAVAVAVVVGKVIVVKGSHGRTKMKLCSDNKESEEKVEPKRG
jgi:hypothetical protein